MLALVLVGCEKEQSKTDQVNPTAQVPKLKDDAWRFLVHYWDFNGKEVIYCTGSDGTCLPTVTVTFESAIDDLNDAVDNNTTTEYFIAQQYEEIWPNLDETVVDSASSPTTKVLKHLSKEGDKAYYSIVPSSLDPSNFSSDDPYYTLPVELP
jgi:hypothetical protein